MIILFNRAGNPENVQSVTKDLEKRERCSLIMMLKALMLRQVMMQDEGRDVFKATAAEWKAVDQKFQTFLNDAIEFVNGTPGKKMRTALNKLYVYMRFRGWSIRLPVAQLRACA